ncbi:hypothetical protein pb186bvf_016783 [Paramecium bursaria]
MQDSFSEYPKSDFYQKFLSGQNLIDESMKTITEKSVKESFVDELNETQFALQRMVACNYRLVEEITKSQQLAAKCADLESQLQLYMRKIETLEDRHLRDLLNMERLERENNILKRKLEEQENNKQLSNKLEINKILQKTDSSFMNQEKFNSKQSSGKYKTPILFTTRPQSPQSSVRQSTPNKSVYSYLLSSTTTNSKTDFSKSCNITRQTIESLLRKTSKHGTSKK